MPMTPREVVRKTVRFENPDRIPGELKWDQCYDFHDTRLMPHPDNRPSNGPDEWGAVWNNIGISSLGEVKDFPLKNWAEWDQLSIPNVRDPERLEPLKTIREESGDRFLLAYGNSLYERIHFIRGLESTWIDIHTNPDELRRLIDVLVDMNLYMIEKYAEAGVDGLIWCDDWGLQDRLMISPDSFRELWKPAYARVYRAAHEAGLLTFLHSCGDITSILDDFIEVGLDVIQMDQQENMGLERLGREFGGRIAFWCPVDIQNTMVNGSMNDIRQYCRDLVAHLGRPEGGFICKVYGDPAGAGHSQEAIDVMCDEFLRLSAEQGKNYTP